MYLNSKVETIVEATDGRNLVVCEHNRVVPCWYYNFFFSYCHS